MRRGQTTRGPGSTDLREPGITVAVQMLHEGLISPSGFLCLCAEAAEAADDICSAAPSHRRERSRPSAAKRERRARHVALSAV